MWRPRRRLGLLLFGIVLTLLGEPLSTVYCPTCHRYLRAMCKPHLDQLANHP